MHAARQLPLDELPGGSFMHRLPTMAAAEELGFCVSARGEWLVDRWRCARCGRTPGRGPDECAQAFGYAQHVAGASSRADLHARDGVRLRPSDAEYRRQRGILRDDDLDSRRVEDAVRRARQRGAKLHDEALVVMGAAGIHAYSLRACIREAGRRRGLAAQVV